VEIRGPAPTPIEKMADEYRVQVWYFTKAVRSTSRRLSEIDARTEAVDGVRMSFDVDAFGLR